MLFIALLMAATPQWTLVAHADDYSRSVFVGTAAKGVVTVSVNVPGYGEGIYTQDYRFTCVKKSLAPLKRVWDANTGVKEDEVAAVLKAVCTR